jgi:predicted nucleic acid-binding protein
LEWVARLHGKLVSLDTAPFIYFIEDHPRYAPQLVALFEAVEQGRIRIVTSVVTLAEVLVRPLRERQADLVTEYRDILLGSPGVEALPVSAAIAERAAELRATHGLRTPDAIQLATAMEAGAAAFLTNDTRLRTVAGLEVLILAELRGV